MKYYIDRVEENKRFYNIPLTERQIEVMNKVTPAPNEFVDPPKVRSEWLTDEKFEAIKEQALNRSWRYGQTAQPIDIYVIDEGSIARKLQSKRRFTFWLRVKMYWIVLSAKVKGIVTGLNKRLS